LLTAPGDTVCFIISRTGLSVNSRSRPTAAFARAFIVKNRRLCVIPRLCVTAVMRDITPLSATLPAITGLTEMAVSVFCTYAVLHFHFVPLKSHVLGKCTTRAHILRRAPRRIACALHCAAAI
jgi:hypothetical protein